MVMTDIQSIEATPEILKHIRPIVDIRTPREWEETGIIEGSITLTFFDELNGYNEEDFLEKLSKLIDINEPFSIICEKGSKTKYMIQILQEYDLKMINLLGGIKVLLHRYQYEMVPYCD